MILSFGQNSEELFSATHVLIAAALSVIAVLLKSLTMLGRVIEFREKHFVVKRYNRLLDLKSNLSPESSFLQYINNSIELEAFQIASGVRASAKKAKVLARIAMVGYWDQSQIRRLAKFVVVTPEQPDPIVRIDKSDKIGAWLGFMMGLLMILAGGYLSITLLIKLPPYGFFVGLLTQVFFTGIGVFVSDDFFRYCGALKLRNYIQENPDLFGRQL